MTGRILTIVITALDPVINARLGATASTAWMAGSSPAMTGRIVSQGTA